MATYRYTKPFQAKEWPRGEPVFFLIPSPHLVAWSEATQRMYFGGGLIGKGVWIVDTRKPNQCIRVLQERSVEAVCCDPEHSRVYVATKDGVITVLDELR